MGLYKIREKKQMTIVSRIEEMLINPEKASRENVNALVREAVQFTNELKNRLASSDESVREQAKKEALKMQTELKKQIKKVYAAQDKDPNAENNPSNPNAFIKTVKNLQNRAPKQRKKPRRVKEWLAS